MILLSFPLKAELQFFVDALKADGHTVIAENTHGPHVHICASLGWIMGYGGHGKTQFAIQTQNMLHKYPQIQHVIASGACGGLSTSLKVGDVIVATHTIEHDFKERFFPQPLPRFAADPVLLEKFKAHTTNVHFGIIASGDEDVVDTLRAEELAQQTEALGVAWEGAGGARLCKYLNIPFLEVRGVTDGANSKAVSDFKTNLKITMANIYKAVFTALNT